MELPQYTVYVETPRILFPKILRIIMLCLVGYVVIWLAYLFMEKEMPFYLIILIIVSMIVIILLSTLYNYSRCSSYNYKFYMNRIDYQGKKVNSILYSQITSVQVNKNLLDILFKTGSIDLNGFSISSIPNINQVFFYVQKMIQINSQYRQQQAQYPSQPSYQGVYQNQPQGQYQQNQYSQQYGQRRF